MEQRTHMPNRFDLLVEWLELFDWYSMADSLRLNGSAFCAVEPTYLPDGVTEWQRLRREYELGQKLFANYEFAG